MATSPSQNLVSRRQWLKWYWQLTWEFVKVSFENRYDNSVLGLLWVLLKPYATFLVLLMIWSRNLASTVDNLVLYLLMGLIFYNFLRDMLTLGANSLENMAYITLKVNFPRQIVVLSAIVNASVTYVINLGFIFAIMIISGISFSAEGLLNLALLSLATLLLALAISLPLSVALVRFTDIKSILELTLFLLFWVTPIMYDVHSNFLPEEVQPVIAASPLTYMINQARASLNIYTEVNFTVSIVIIVIALILLAICWPRFDKWTQKVSEYY